MTNIKEKKQMANKSNPQQEPVPPPIPLAASSSVKRDRGFQTQLQQYLSSFLNKIIIQTLQSNRKSILYNSY